MLWPGLALVAHAGNALVFIVDKSLLGTGGAIAQPVRYAFYSGLLAGAAVILLPFSFAPLTLFMVQWSAVAGLFHLGALWLFFRALKSGEPSRVVPIAGSAVPLFTLLFAIVTLGEVLVARQLVAVGFLIVGGALLSIRLARSESLSAVPLLTTVASGALFAAYFATIKFLYDHTEPFLAVFAYSRMVEAVLALVLLGPVMLGTRRVLSSAMHPPAVATRRSGLLISTVFVANKALAAGAFLLQSYAISLGSVTVVNALQGTQYLFLLLLAGAISLWWPRLFREELGRVALGQKVAGIAMIGAGLVLFL